jgi:Polyketide cyclase / dehydrase and lipid transport
MKIIVLVLAALAGLILLMALIGAGLPRAHQATRTALLHRPPSEVYAVIRDFAAMPSWRSSLPGVEILPPRDGHACFREISRHRPITYIVLEDKAPEKLVTQIADANLPFGGTWTYQISPEANGSRVRITERGEVKNTLFRFLARFVFGYTGTMEAYLRDLGKKFGEPVAPAP